ncbi:MAG: hypothetical protein QNJ13_10915 [Paracoccaceae bacterium]|nr:hypothetical protein [Paracoccaceae bacterium]
MANLVSTYVATTGTPDLNDATLSIAESPAQPGRIVSTVDQGFLDALGGDYQIRPWFGDASLGLVPAVATAANQTMVSRVSNSSFAGAGAIRTAWLLVRVSDLALLQQLDAPQVPDFAILPVLSGATGGVGETTATLRVTTDTAEGTLYRLVSESAAPLGAAGVQAAATEALAVSAAGQKSRTYSGLTAETAYFEHAVHEVVVGGVSYFSAESVTAFATTAAGAGGGTGAHDGVEDGTVYLSPRHLESDMDVRLETGQFGTAGATEFTIRLATLDGVDITDSFSAGQARIVGAGELVVTASYGGTVYTARGWVYPEPAYFSDPLFATYAGGNGKAAMVPAYEVKTATDAPTSPSGFRAAIEAAPDGAELVFDDFTDTGATLDFSNLGAKRLTLRCRTLHGVNVNVLNIRYSHNLTLVGFKCNELNSQISGVGYNTLLVVEYCEIRSPNIVGYPLGGGLHEGDFTMRYCTARPAGGQHQWGIRCDTLTFEQNICWRNTNNKDILNINVARHAVMRHNVFGYISYENPAAHADLVQFQAGSVAGLFARNVLIDDGSGSSIDQMFAQGLAMQDTFDITDFLVAENLVIWPRNNGIFLKRCRRNVLVRDNSVQSKIRISAEDNDAASVRGENNVMNGLDQFPTTASDGVMSGNFSANILTPYPGGLANSQPRIEDFFGIAAGWEDRGASPFILKLAAVL